ncbi:hypothetical protein ARMSODRAFT_57272 [Armillaria solidipes]|uniref:N-acetyltransferase domain-containing protein n=1 Tax=Armillaria solidipes TaxID=1076256 RepID=A0A2H3CU55_9AGAR|nr:hypothetical protein ARMSODRAFT_57272 [Armillaria solidipes]
MTAFIPGDDLQLVLTNSELSDTPGFGPDEPSLWFWLQNRRFSIQLKLTNVEIGYINVQFINAPKTIDHFFEELDAHSHELSNFALQVFDQYGYLKQEVEAGGLGLWDAEDAYKMYVRPMVYIQELVVMESWRSRGVGSWAVPQLFDTHEVKAIRSSYLFAWPAVLNHLEPMFPQTTTEACVAKGERVIKFFRSIGFRRLANTSFFCLAKDPAHRSRQIAANEDAEFKTLPPPKDDNEVIRRILASW